MENRAYAVAAGLFVILLSCAVILVIWWFGGSNIVTRDLIIVTQRSVSGLNPQAQVRYRGIRAGKVVDIDIDPEDSRNILITVRVESRLPLTLGTTAQLGYQGVTGLAYVSLDDEGSNRSPLMDVSGRPPRIALKPSVIDVLGDRAGSVLEHVDDLTRNLNQSFDEQTVRHFKRTVENVAVASEGLRDMPQLTASARAVLSAENIQTLRHILSHLERTSGETTPMVVETRSLIASMQNLSRHLDEMSARIGDDVSQTTVPRMNSLMQDVQGNSRQLKRILDRLESEPESILFGRQPTRPGPGEDGFVKPTGSPG